LNLNDLMLFTKMKSFNQKLITNKKLLEFLYNSL